MSPDKVAAIIDVLILAWLVGTWFFEGHHKRCRVEVTCPSCGRSTETCCSVDRRHGEKETT